MPFGSGVLPEDFQFFGKGCVVRQFHLINGDAFRVHRDRLADAVPPVVVRFADHAGDEIDIDLVEADIPCPTIGPIDLVLEVRPTVELQDFRFEVFDA